MPTAESNEVYPYESSTDSTNVEELPNWSTFPKLCRVCGFKATKSVVDAAMPTTAVKNTKSSILQDIRIFVAIIAIIMRRR